MLTKDFRRGREEAEMKAVKKTMRDLYALAGNRMRQWKVNCLRFRFLLNWDIKMTCEIYWLEKGDLWYRYNQRFEESTFYCHWGEKLLRILYINLYTETPYITCWLAETKKWDCNNNKKTLNKPGSKGMGILADPVRKYILSEVTSWVTGAWR